MATYREDIQTIELESGSINRSFMNHTIGEGDKEGNRFGVRIYRNGTPESLTGCIVTGYFIRADGTTIIIAGIASGNMAYVSLPQNCYEVEGNFTLAIKITGGTVTGTMRIIDGTVVNTTTDTIIDPGGIVPDIEEIMALIERLEDDMEIIDGFTITEELISGDDYRLVVDVVQEGN